MIQEIRYEVNRIYQNFRETSGIEVTEPTRELVAQIISAISEDPHPSWQIDDQHQSITQAYLAALPMFFYQIVSTQPPDQPRITSFDFLHWFARNLEMSICIIKKP